MTAAGVIEQWVQANAGPMLGPTIVNSRPLVSRVETLDRHVAPVQVFAVFLRYNDKKHPCHPISA